MCAHSVHPLCLQGGRTGATPLLSCAGRLDISSDIQQDGNNAVYSCSRCVTNQKGGTGDPLSALAA